MARLAEQEKVLNMVAKLVSDDHLAVDFEMGLCRFCNARIEAWEPQYVEHHKPDCPWEGVRKKLGMA